MLFLLSTIKIRVGTKIHLFLYLLKTCWSVLIKKRLIGGWVILIIPIFCRSLWMSLSVIYIFTILMVSTHPWGYRWSSSPAVPILWRATTSCTIFLAKIMWGNTRSLSEALSSRICGSRYQHTSCIQIENLIRLVPAQDVHFFYTHSHLSALQNCAVLFSTNFQIIFIFKKCTTQFSHWIV